MRRRMERIHLALCRLFVAQKRAMERGAPRIDYWGDLDTQQQGGDARPSFMDMANAFDELLANE
jgi:hypothetical protein